MLVLSAGYGATVQDRGRFGFRKFGVPTTGALDSAALRVLNLLVGNDEDAAGLEISTGRVGLQLADERLVAWSGGDFEVRVGTVTVPHLRCAHVPRDTLCEILPKRGRAWLAISGGIDVPPLLGSRSTDLRARFGGHRGRTLRDGDELPLAPRSERAERIAQQMTGALANWSGPQLLSSRAELGMTLNVISGNNWDDTAGAQLLRGKFRVALNSDRMGLRLEGPSVDSAQGELISEAVAPGTIQLPPGGAPIVLLADCQTIGGYPKLAHVITVDLARAAQWQPMDEVGFELTTLDHAAELLQQRERDIALLRAGLCALFG
ncbi:MAG: hypothetical protein DLM52_01075 [Chthoniobacterales bacterium]|nr:MAG: hypothetical protein DLM52_01075 [Chthoniobacterales bacterium]